MQKMKIGTRKTRLLSKIGARPLYFQVAQNYFGILIGQMDPSVYDAKISSSANRIYIIKDLM